MEPVRVEARLIRPGHLIRLEYGRRLDLAVETVTIEPGWVRLDGPVSHPGCEPHDYATNTRHSHTTRLPVLADRNDPPYARDGWNGLTRVIRQWTNGVATVWALDDPTEPIGHGGRLLGAVNLAAGVWMWRAAFGDASGTVAGNYIDGEAALIAAVNPCTIEI